MGHGFRFFEVEAVEWGAEARDPREKARYAGAMLFLGRGTRLGVLAATLAGATLLGCGDNSDGMAPLPEESEDVAGVYTVSLTHGDNGCDFDPWEEGEETSLELALTQDDRELTGEVTDPWLTEVLGSGEFEGTVAGNHFTLENQGTQATTDGDCSFTGAATIRGQVDGDVIEGTVTYTYETNGDPSCGERETCESVQQLTGTRAPAK
jgi:hypothetical protein